MSIDQANQILLTQVNEERQTMLEQIVDKE